MIPVLGDDAPQLVLGCRIAGPGSIEVADGHGAKQAGLGRSRQHAVDARFSFGAPLARQHIAVMKNRAVLFQFAPGVVAGGSLGVGGRGEHKEEGEDALGVDAEKLFAIDGNVRGVRGGGGSQENIEDDAGPSDGTPLRWQNFRTGT